jgi:hypothetical protein
VLTPSTGDNETCTYKTIDIVQNDKCAPMNSQCNIKSLNGQDALQGVVVQPLSNLKGISRMCTQAVLPRTPETLVSLPADNEIHVRKRLGAVFYLLRTSLST